MTNNVRTIYLYIVSFITLGMIVGGIASIVNNVASYYYPDAYIFFSEDSSDSDYIYDYSETNERKIQRENYKSERIKNAIVSAAVIVIGAIMYKYHWNLIEKERKNI